MHPSLRAALLATALAGAAAPGARAADVTPEQARSLEAQLRGWLQGLAGPTVRMPDRPIRVAPDGEKFSLSVPLGIGQTGSPEPLTLFSSARPLDGGRWAFEGPRLPTPSRFTVDVPTPPTDAQKAQGKTAGTPVPIEYTMTVGSEEGLGVFDPSFQTPSTLSTSFRDLQIEARGDGMTQTTRIARSAGTTTLRPSGADRADYVLDGSMEGYTLRSKAGDSEPLVLTAQRMRVSGELTSVSRQRVAQMMPALVRLTADAMAGLPKSASKAAPVASAMTDPAVMRALLQSLEDLASEFKLDQTMDGIAASYGAVGGAADQLRIGLGAKAERGLLQVSMELGLDGLALPDLPLGAMAELLPRKIALRPVLTGIPVPELMRLLAAAGEQRKGGTPAEFTALLRKGTVGAGLESFALDIGGASFAGMGKVTIASPEVVRGQAQITATNFDALLAKANAIPELQGIVPAFVFAKGIGRAVDNRVVWDITYRDSKVLVNGTDLSAMMGGARK